MSAYRITEIQMSACMCMISKNAYGPMNRASVPNLAKRLTTGGPSRAVFIARSGARLPTATDSRCCCNYWLPRLLVALRM
jgi:hypothetical protein